jgi:Fic family protein
MDPKLFESSDSGRVIQAEEGYFAFVPNPLPPIIPWETPLISLLAKASQSVGSLAGFSETLSNPSLLIYPFIRREAVLSSRIEGTRASLSDLFLFEATGIEKQKDVKEVHNYVKALEYGIHRLRETRLNLKLIAEIHAVLLKGVGGGYAVPGKYRKEQNWIGPPKSTKFNATYVPPPAREMQKCLRQLELFLSTKNHLPALIKAALIHYQFEAIHPFLDGNGRVGRLLIMLYLHQQKVIPKPLLYLSPFFEIHREKYYGHLLNVSRKGDWLKWLGFFINGVVDQVCDLNARALKLLKLQDRYRRLVYKNALSPTAGRLLDLFLMRPVMNISAATQALKVTFPAVSKAMKRLSELGIVQEITKGKKNMVFIAQEVMDILGERK